MHEIDKIINQVAQIMGWLRSGKDNEFIRNEMYTAAAKTCRELAERIEQLPVSETAE